MEDEQVFRKTREERDCWKNVTRTKQSKVKQQLYLNELQLLNVNHESCLTTTWKWKVDEIYFIIELVLWLSARKQSVCMDTTHTICWRDNHHDHICTTCVLLYYVLAVFIYCACACFLFKFTPITLIEQNSPNLIAQIKSNQINSNPTKNTQQTKTLLVVVYKSRDHQLTHAHSGVTFRPWTRTTKQPTTGLMNRTKNVLFLSLSFFNHQ